MTVNAATSRRGAAIPIGARAVALSIGLAGALALAGCFPAPVDPNATFTLRASLVDETGAPAANTEVHAYLIDRDVRQGRDDDLLHYDDIEQYPDLNSQKTFTSDADGNLDVDIAGSDLNSADGSRGLSLALVYQSGGDRYAYLATASHWEAFSDADPVMDVGTLRLWDGGSTTDTNRQTASQSAKTVVFDWSQNDAPANSVRDDSRPFFIFVYDANGSVRWADHTFAASATMPRGACADDLATSPDYFIVGYSKESSGSRRYLHRTRLRTSLSRPIDGWSTTAVGTGGNNYLTPGAGAALVDEAGNAFAEAARDGDLATRFDFIGVATTRGAFYVDLGAVRSFRDLLIYDLGVVGLSDATIKVSLSNDDTSVLANVGTWRQLTTYTGDYDFENWVYIGWTGSESARWIQILVSGTHDPYFAFMDEVMVKY